MTASWKRRIARAALLLSLALLPLALATPVRAADFDTDLVSRASGVAGEKGNDTSSQGAVSAGGRFVAFQSLASNLYPDPDGGNHIFVRDLETNVTTLVDRATGPAGAKANDLTAFGGMSDDGRFVVFESMATNLHPDDPDMVFDIFVRDLQTSTTTLVSRATGVAGAKGNASSLDASISADGRFVVFSSGASNLDPDAADGNGYSFVRDLETNTTTLVSRATGVAGAKANQGAGSGSISADGRFVAFWSNSTNLDPDDGDGTTDVFVRDLQAHTTELVSRASGSSGAKGNSYSSQHPFISGDGRFVAFTSKASNLHPDDSDPADDIFVRDLVAKTTTLVSRASGVDGAKANGYSYGGSISGDGRFIAFHSNGVNLTQTTTPAESSTSSYATCRQARRRS